jgi:hypothetical protein
MSAFGGKADMFDRKADIACLSDVIAPYENCSTKH